MKKLTLFTIVLVMAMSLCACRMGNNEETTTVPTTLPEVTTAPGIIVPDITIPDPTIETNIPDTNVDNDHLTDTTEDHASEDGGDAVPSVGRRLN